MKKFLLTFLLTVTNFAFSENEILLFDYSKYKITQSIGFIGNSQILKISIPACPNNSNKDCLNFESIYLFNCNTKKTYSLGQDENQLDSPNPNNYFEPTDIFDKKPSRINKSCATKKEQKRKYIFLRSKSENKSTFIISDTAKKEGSIVNAWFEEIEHKKVLRKYYSSTPPNEIQDFMYELHQSPDSVSKKYNQKFDCKERKQKLISLIEYDKGGYTKNSYDYSDTKFDPVVPDSVGETTLNVVCALF